MHPQFGQWSPFNKTDIHLTKMASRSEGSYPLPLAPVENIEENRKQSENINIAPNSNGVKGTGVGIQTNETLLEIRKKQCGYIRFKKILSKHIKSLFTSVIQKEYAPVLFRTTTSWFWCYHYRILQHRRILMELHMLEEATKSIIWLFAWWNIEKEANSVELRLQSRCIDELDHRSSVILVVFDGW